MSIINIEEGYNSFIKNYDYNTLSQFSLINYNILDLSQLENICKYIFVDNQMKIIEKIIYLIDI